MFPMAIWEAMGTPCLLFHMSSAPPYEGGDMFPMAIWKAMGTARLPYPMSSSPTGRMQLPPSTLHLRQLWLISSTPSGAKLHGLRTALAAARASATAVLTAGASQPTASSSDPSTTVLLCALTVGTPCPSVALPPTLRRGPEPRLRQAGFERSSRHVGPAGQGAVRSAEQHAPRGAASTLGPARRKRAQEEE